MRPREIFYKVGIRTASHIQWTEWPWSKQCSEENCYYFGSSCGRWKGSEWWSWNEIDHGNFRSWDYYYFSHLECLTPKNRMNKTKILYKLTIQQRVPLVTRNFVRKYVLACSSILEKEPNSKRELKRQRKQKSTLTLILKERS